LKKEGRKNERSKEGTKAMGYIIRVAKLLRKLREREGERDRERMRE
jgi:hypothetical protein